MKISVFSLRANLAIDKPLFSLKKQEAPDDFFLVDVGELCGGGRFKRVGRRSLQLMQKHITEQEQRIIPGNWSGGDPALWVIVGQTSERYIGPGFPRYNLLALGAPGLS